MLWPAESVYRGTWAAGQPVPAEVADFELMLGMGWSWADLQSTPPYVRRYAADLLAIRRRVGAENNEEPGGQQ